MPADFGVVYPNRRVVVHGLEVKQDVSPGPGFGNAHRSPIPDGLHKTRVADTGKLRLRTKRHENVITKLARQQIAIQAVICVIDFKLPTAVQAQPVVPNELGARIFTARNFHVNFSQTLRGLMMRLSSSPRTRWARMTASLVNGSISLSHSADLAAALYHTFRSRDSGASRLRSVPPATESLRGTPTPLIPIRLLFVRQASTAGL